MIFCLIRQIFPLQSFPPYGRRSFRVFPRESAADEDEESGSGQTVYADFDFSMCFLIGGLLMLEYDGNMALLKVSAVANKGRCLYELLLSFYNKIIEPTRLSYYPSSIS